MQVFVCSEGVMALCFSVKALDGSRRLSQQLGAVDIHLAHYTSKGERGSARDILSSLTTVFAVNHFLLWEVTVIMSHFSTLYPELFWNTMDN